MLCLGRVDGAESWVGLGERKTFPETTCAYAPSNSVSAKKNLASRMALSSESEA